jgi:hypothetical protein
LEAIPGEVARSQILDRFSERADAEDSEIGERASGLYAKRQIDEEHIAELETYIRAEANAPSIVLDLKDVTLAGRDAVNFLERCEADGVILKNCA